MTEIEDERERPGYAEITQPVVAEPCGDLIDGKRRTWAEVRTTEQRPGLRTWQIAHCAEVRDAELIAALINAALASPSEGNKKGEEPKIIDDDLLDIYVGMRRGHDWPGKSRPQEQPRKATPEMVDAAVRDYGKWASGGASRERIEHTLNAALAVSVSPAAAQGWQTTKAADLPPPHTLIDDGRDQCALMFHYLPADVSFKAVADERGYDIIAVPMENDPAAADLLSRYEDGEDVIADWKPTIPDGWLFGAKIDTEDGASAIFIRKQLPAAPPSPAAQEQKPGAIIWDNMP